MAVVLATPWCFGGVVPWWQSWCLIVLTICLACGILDTAARRCETNPLPTLLWVLLLALACGFVQLIPLSPEVQRRLTPKGSEFRDQLLPEAPVELALPPVDLATLSSGHPVAERQLPVSLYPAATRQELSLLAMGALAFALGARFFSTPQAQRILLTLVAVNGAALAFFGLIQRLSWNGLIYWSIPFGSSNAFGPFVNQNNAGGYLNLALGAAIGSFLFAQADVPHPNLTRRRTAGEFLGSLNGSKLLAAFLAVVLIAGVICTLSRGATIALVAGLLTTAFMAKSLPTGRISWRPILMCLAAAATTLIWLGFGDRVLQRLGSLTFQGALLTDGRILNWKESLASVQNFWLTGSGLGTYGSVYRPYELAHHVSWHQHAENQYLEALVGAGWLGLGLLLVAIALLVRAVVVLYKCGNPSEHARMATVGAFALSTQAVQAGVDFGLYIPANLLLMAVLCGAVAGTAARLSGTVKLRWPASIAIGGDRVWPQAAILIVVGVGVWASQEMFRVAPIDTLMRQTRWGPDNQEITEPQLAAAISALTPAVQRRPDDAEAHLRLAWLWMRLYRLRALEQLRQELSPTLDEFTLQALAKPSQLHYRAAQDAIEGKPEALTKLRALPVVANYLQPAWSHLAAAREACPFDPEVHFQLGVLAFIAGDPLQDRVDFDRVRLLAPYNVDYRYELALLDLDSGRTAAALADLRASWEATPWRQDEILDVLARRLGDAPWLAQVTPDDPELLLRLAETRCTGNSPLAKHRASILARAESLLAATSSPRTSNDAEHSYLLGRLARARGDVDSTVRHFQRAIELRPEDAELRYELAVFLLENGRLEAAHEQIQACLSLQPDVRKYVDLMNRVRERLPNRKDEDMLEE